MRYHRLTNLYDPWLGGRFHPQTIRVHYFWEMRDSDTPTDGCFIADTERVHRGGDEAMRERPIGPLVDALKALGIGIQYTGEAGFPPLKLQGGAFSHSTQHSTVAYPANISRRF